MLKGLPQSLIRPCFTCLGKLVYQHKFYIFGQYGLPLYPWVKKSYLLTTATYWLWDKWLTCTCIMGLQQIKQIMRPWATKGLYTVVGTFFSSSNQSSRKISGECTSWSWRVQSILSNFHIPLMTLLSNRL